MEANFWHQKWEKGEIAFHQKQANPLLVAHVEKLKLQTGSRIFLPLCGKTLDIAWLLASGFRVVGAELSEIAISELFKSLSLQPETTTVGKLTRYSAKDIDIYVGNIFDLTAQILGPVSAIYDRAALVALPADTRKKYAAHMVKNTDALLQLLITYEYDQSLIDGPPFSVNGEELKRLYGATYSLKALEMNDVEGGMKGKAASTETAWLLQKISV